MHAGLPPDHACSYRSEPGVLAIGLTYLLFPCYRRFKTPRLRPHIQRSDISLTSGDLLFVLDSQIPIARSNFPHLWTHPFAVQKTSTSALVFRPLLPLFILQENVYSHSRSCPVLAWRPLLVCLGPSKAIALSTAIMLILV